MTKRSSQIAIVSAVMSLTAIILLHFLSSDIDPTWHMVSEYAYGKYGWLLSLFFFSWAVSYWATGMAFIPLAKNVISKVSIFLLFVTGFGALMGGLFDVRHNLHGLAFAIGIPFVPIAAPLLTRYLRRTYNMSNTYSFITSNAVWISFILMGVSMGFFMSQMQRAGALNMDTPQFISTLPEGVTPIIGYTNRFLVFSYIGWLIAINCLILKIKKLK